MCHIKKVLGQQGLFLLQKRTIALPESSLNGKDIRKGAFLRKAVIHVIPLYFRVRGVFLDENPRIRSVLSYVNRMKLDRGAYTPSSQSRPKSGVNSRSR